MSTINLSEAKDKLSKLVKDTAETTKPVVITVNGREQVVLISMAEYDSLKETIEILKDQEIVKQIGASMKDIAGGDVVNFDDIKREI